MGAMEMWLDREIASVGEYLKRPGAGLRFSPRLERRYLIERARKNRGSFYLIAMFAVIVMNLSGVGMTLNGVVPAEHKLRAFVESQVGMVIPILITAVIMRRFPRSMIHYDKMLALQCFGGAIGLVVLGREIAFPISLYHAFTLPMLPIAFNLLLGMRFVYAAPMASYYLGVFLISDLMNGEFSADAKFFLVLSLGFSTVGSLIANFRVERAERLNFLRLWRDNLRNIEIERANRDLALLSRTDGLTGLLNRREFDARFAAESARARADGKPLTLIVIDIDHFKLYNDRLGHPQGDKCIQAVARALADAVGPPPNFAGRIGGEEFAAVLPRASAEAAATAAQSIRSAVEAMQWPHPALGDRRIVSISIGVACLNPARPETPEGLMGRADAALYRAKRAGRDRAEVDLRLVGA